MSEILELPVMEIMEMIAYHDIKESWLSEARAKAKVEAQLQNG